MSTIAHSQELAPELRQRRELRIPGLPITIATQNAFGVLADVVSCYGEALRWAEHDALEAGREDNPLLDLLPEYIGGERVDRRRVAGMIPDLQSNLLADGQNPFRKRETSKVPHRIEIDNTIIKTAIQAVATGKAVSSRLPLVNKAITWKQELDDSEAAQVSILPQALAHVALSV